MTQTTATPAPTFRSFPVGSTVYTIDSDLKIVAGVVTAVSVAANGYPHTTVRFPTPLRVGGEREWAVERLMTRDEAEAQVAENKLMFKMFAL